MISMSLLINFNRLKILLGLFSALRSIVTSPRNHEGSASAEHLAPVLYMDWFTHLDMIVASRLVQQGLRPLWRHDLLRSVVH